MMPSDVFIQNRKNLVAQLKPNSVVVVNANDIMPTNSDGTMRFKQNSDLFYLTGVDQEETILLLCPNFPDEKYREVLFVKETSELIAIWEGHKLTKEEGKNVSGIKSVMWLSEFNRFFNTVMLMGGTEFVYLNTNDHYRASIDVETREARFVTWCKEKFPLHNYQRLAPIMHRLRSIKSSSEIDALQKACDITELGFRRVLKFVKPGVKEYEIEAEWAHEFIRHGSRGFAYEPIIASGANSCVLHYIDNDKACKDGDLLLLDVGAEYGNYNADLTRTIPVNGKFSARQRAIYNAVLRVHRFAYTLLKEGVLYYEYHKEIQRFMADQLVELKLISKSDQADEQQRTKAVMKYFMHGTGHQLGLDVHDVGSMYHAMQVGQVWTVEPGIYIPAEGLGVRIENNVVIEKNGVRDLMKNVPIEIEEIESIMNEK
jgi:Xaa-Pro aminopeptidase